MNLSQVKIEIEEKQPDVKPELRKREARLLKLIEALESISQSKEWSTLKTEVFEGLVSNLEKDIKYEAKKEDPDPKKLNRLSGELKWAEKYADLSKLADNYKLDLKRIRTQLYDKE